jgi:DNA replication protein DnaC
MTQRRSGGGWTKLVDRSWIKVPTTPAPDELYWECETCGPIKPYANPLGQWQRRSCACQRRAKQELQMAEHRTAWLHEQRIYAYGGWLGKQWVSQEVVAYLNTLRFDNYDATRFPQAFKRAQEFALAPHGNLIIYGRYGVGKTHLEAAIANYLREKRPPVICLFASAPQFFMAYEEARFSDGAGTTNHHTLLHRATTADILILDDVDKYKHTETREDLYYTIIDERYLSAKPTILSMNNLDALPRYIGEAACSRLSRGLATIKMVGGTDYRQEQA